MKITYLVSLFFIIPFFGCGYPTTTYYPSVPTFVCDSSRNDDYELSLIYLDSTGNGTSVDFSKSPDGSLKLGLYQQPLGYNKVAFIIGSFVDEEKSLYCSMRGAFCAPFGSNLLGNYQWANPLVQDTDVGVMLTFSKVGEPDDIYYSESGTITVLQSDVFFQPGPSFGSWNAVYYGIVRNSYGRRLQIKCGKFGSKGS